MQKNLTRTKEELKKLFFTLATPEDIVALLEIPYSVLIYHLYRIKEDRRYRSFQIAKKNGGHRLITTPLTRIKLIQKKLSLILNSVYEPKSSVHGFVMGKSVVTNADKHSKKKYVLNIDLQDFFGSINFGRIRGMFKGKPYNLPDKVATVLAQICSFQNQLPLGAPTSPVAANMVCARLDSDLQRLAKKYLCTYTRYADDISISTTRKRFPNEIAFLDYSELPPKLILAHELRQLFENNGFKVNLKKTRLQLPYNRHIVTGLTANEFPNINRRYLNNLRAMLHAWRKYGLQNAQAEHLQKYSKKHRNPVKISPTFNLIVRGKLNYLSMVRGTEDPIFIKYAKQLSEIDPDYKFIYDAKIQIQQDRTKPENAVWVLEDEKSNTQGTAFFLEGVGLVTCNHVVYGNTCAFRTQMHSKKYLVEIMYSDKDIDLAILRLDIQNIIYLKRAPNKSVKQGDKIKVYGFPNYSFGQTVQIFPGTVAGFKNRFGLKRILISAPIIAGNSGGPVLNDKNEVIGIAATGSETIEGSLNTEAGVIPIEAIDYLVK